MLSPEQAHLAALPHAPALEAPATSTARDLLSLTKPRLSTLVLITASGGLWLSETAIGTASAAAAILGTTLVVGGANALNNYIERDSDRLMVRTANRPLPAGRMAAGTALAFGLVLSAASIAILGALTTPLATALAAAALVLYVAVYTPMKRSSSFSTLVGAIPGALPPLIGWTAASGQIELGGMLLFALLFLWQIPHSLAIGMYRQEDYERAGLVVFPSEHGAEATRRQILLYTMALAPLPAVIVHAGVGGPVTLFAGSALGMVFLWKAARGYATKGGARWARKLFLFSLLHLSGLFATLAIDALIR